MVLILPSRGNDPRCPPLLGPARSGVIRRGNTPDTGDTQKGRKAQPWWVGLPGDPPEKAQGAVFTSEEHAVTGSQVLENYRAQNRIKSEPDM